MSSVTINCYWYSVIFFGVIDLSMTSNDGLSPLRLLLLISIAVPILLTSVRVYDRRPCADISQSFRSRLSSALLVSLTSDRGVRRIALPDLALYSFVHLNSFKLANLVTHY